MSQADGDKPLAIEPSAFQPLDPAAPPPPKKSNPLRWVLLGTGALFLLVMAFLLFTTALTEEVFFRGYLQTRLERLTGSRFAGLLLASVLFGVYHLPYAYLNPMWPSSGDWGAAFSAALGQGIPGGLILGGLFIYARGNLVAPILVHAAVDLLPASTMIKIQGL